MAAKKKIIIFGATGNVGSYLLKYALEYFNQTDYEIIASGRRQTDFFSKRGVPYYSVDLTCKSDFAKLPTKGVYAVILLSGMLPAYMRGYEPQLYIDSIITGGYNVLEYCRVNHIDRILYSQTIFDFSAYPHNLLLKANAPQKYKYTGDHVMYVIAKNAMLDMMEHYYQQYGLKKFVFRFPSIYSYTPDPYYYQDGVRTKRPLWIMIEKAQKGEPIEIWGDGKYAKDMVHVYDCSQMICRAVEANLEHGIYNVGTGHPVTMEEQVRTIVDVFSPADHRSEISYLPNKVCWGGFLMDISNAVFDLGYQPQYDCRRILEDFKYEMQVQRFRELRCGTVEKSIHSMER